jgi:hypothetical protein
LYFFWTFRHDTVFFFFDVIFNFTAILNFHDWQYILYNKLVYVGNYSFKIKTFHSAVSLPENHQFLFKKSAILKFSAIMKKILNNLEEKKKKDKYICFKRVNVSRSIWNLGAILNFYAWTLMQKKNKSISKICK